jgi:alpha-L-rhamnosidase
MKHPARYFVAIAFVILSACNSRNTEVYDLKCENLHDPLGLGTLVPRFSWKVSAKRNATEQKAFQILVSGDPALLEEGKADLWDTGKLESGECVLLPYGGRSLRSGIPVWWKVRIWDEKGEVSRWSKPARFSIGLLNPDDWKASFIGLSTEEGRAACPQLRQTFTAPASGRLFLHVNSLGYHEVWLNGKKAGDGVLAPAMVQFNKRSQIVTYDLTGNVKRGVNELKLWLTSGWYREGLPGVMHGTALVRAQLEMVGKNGQQDVCLITDSSWTGRLSAYTAYGSWKPAQFGGETLNGMMTGDDMAPGDLSPRWQPVTVVKLPDVPATPQPVEQNILAETIVAQEIKPAGKDTFLIDMGTTLTGWIEIVFPRLQRSQKVRIEYSDHLDTAGKFVEQKQTDLYIAAGEGIEKFINKFNYHGFRYIRLSGLSAAPAAGSVTARLVQTGFEQAGTFECSDPDLNRIHNMVQYTLRCLSLGGYLVDCPHLERLGYGGDGNASTTTAQTMFNLGPLYTNWLQAWADCIRDDGGMPHTAPNPYKAGGGPYWCGFIITASWKTFLNYGDTAIIRRHYPVMQKWLEYVDRYSVDGLLKRWPDTDYRGWYLGDWAVPDGVDQTAEASVNLVNNCFLTVCYDNLAEIAGVLGKPGDAGLYSSKRDALKEKVCSCFFDPQTCRYGTGSQIDLTYPLLAGIVPESWQENVERELIRTIAETHQGHLALGLVGIPVFTEWAVKNHQAGLMYSMLKKQDYPGYLYMIDNGATTTWEHWNGQRSRIHNCYNGIGSWFYQALGGIRPVENVPAYREVIIDPQIPDGITWAKTSKETPYGKLAVNWEISDSYLQTSLEIPVGITAHYILPEGTDSYTLNGELHTGREVSLQSGRHHLSISL